MSEVLAVPSMEGVAVSEAAGCRVAVLWIDWYAYHVARFRGLAGTPGLAGRVVGLELVGGVGVHAGMKFREELAADLRVETMFPEGDWGGTSKGAMAREVWRRLNRLSPEVVLVPGYYTVPGLAAAVWAKMHGRVSVLMTESTAEDHARVGWKEWLKSRLIRTLFDWAVAGGKAHARYLGQLGFPAGRIAGFYDVVDNGMYREGVRAARVAGRAAYGLPEKYFLYVGRLAPEKNVRGLVAAWRTYRADGGTWALVLVGDGPERAGLEASVVGCEGEVVFAGHQGSRAMLPFYAFAECFVLPSEREPWGLVVNEAMASGLPVIVSARCGCAEDLVEDGENGFLFDPGVEGALAFLLRRMEDQGEARRARMGNRAAARVAEYTPERFGLEIARIAEAGR